MEGVRSPSPEIQDCYFKNIFPNMLPDTSSGFISDIGVTDHRNYDHVENKIENLHLLECSLKIGLFGSQLFRQKHHFLYIVLWRYKRDSLHASIDIFYIIFYVINMMKKHQSLLYHVCMYLRYKKGADLNRPPPPYLSPLFVQTVGVIMMDLSKAFDILNHKLLLKNCWFR